MCAPRNSARKGGRLEKWGQPRGIKGAREDERGIESERTDEGSEAKNQRGVCRRIEERERDKDGRGGRVSVDGRRQTSEKRWREKSRE